MKEIVNGKILVEAFNSLIDNVENVNLENPNTYLDVVMDHKLDIETGNVYVYKQDVNALIHEKEKKTQRDAVFGLRIESFTKFLQEKYGKENIFCLPMNKSLMLDITPRIK